MVDPYAAGYRAWHQNDDFNPYDLDSDDYIDWERGWDDATTDDSEAAWDDCDFDDDDYDDYEDEDDQHWVTDEEYL